MGNLGRRRRGMMTKTKWEDKKWRNKKWGIKTGCPNYWGDGKGANEKMLKGENRLADKKQKQKGIKRRQ